MDIGSRTDAQWWRSSRLVNELTENEVENVSDPNLGGTVEFDGGWVPCHYDTFPPIETDAEAFKSDVEASEVVILQPGESHTA